MSIRTFRAEAAAGPVMVAVALAGTVLSFLGIYRLALHAGWSPLSAWLLPVSVDGLVLAGVLQVLQATAAGTSRKYGWALTSVGALISVAANAATATPAILAAVNQNWLAAATHALPVVSVVLTLEAWLYMRRGGIQKAAQDAATADREAELTASLAESMATVAAGVEENDKLRTRVAALEAEISKVATSTVTPAAVELKGKTASKALTAVPDTQPAADRDALAAQALRLREGGLTLPKVASELGVSLSSVKRLLSQSATTSAA